MLPEISTRNSAKWRQYVENSIILNIDLKLTGGVALAVAEGWREEHCRHILALQKSKLKWQTRQPLWRNNQLAIAGHSMVKSAPGPNP